jgi:hypothetical protein
MIANPGLSNAHHASLARVQGTTSKRQQAFDLTRSIGLATAVPGSMR